MGKKTRRPRELHQGTYRVLCAAWPQVREDLASTRRGAELFLNGFHDIYESSSRRSWAARWMDVGDAHCLVGELSAENGAFDKTTEAWLCALTAFEVARRLVDEGDQQEADLSAKVEASIQRFGTLMVERVHIPFCDGLKQAYYLPAGCPDSCAPAVICISSEDETGATLLARLLPVLSGRNTSALVVSHNDVSNHLHGQSELFLSCCLDYLSARADVDAARIAVYGEGLSAALSTDFALSDHRVAAVVCDGGLWNWARTRASVRWLTGAGDLTDENTESILRSRLARQLKCPVLVVAGGRGIVSVPEAMKLEADCTSVRNIDLELVMLRMTQTPVGELENYVAADECIFSWLDRKLVRSVAAR